MNHRARRFYPQGRAALASVGVGPAFVESTLLHPLSSAYRLPREVRARSYFALFEPFPNRVYEGPWR